MTNMPNNLDFCKTATGDDEPELLIIESAAVDQRAEWGDWARDQSQKLIETGYWRAFRFGPVLRLRHVCFCN